MKKTKLIKNSIPTTLLKIGTILHSGTLPSTIKKIPVKLINSQGQRLNISLESLTKKNSIIAILTIPKK